MAKKAIDQEIGIRIAKIRTQRGLSQQGLADAVHVSKGTIQHYEHGRYRITGDRIRRIALVLRCSPSDLLERDRRRRYRPARFFLSGSI